MQRIAIWHRYWQGMAQRIAREDQAECTPRMRANLCIQAEAALRAASS